MTTVSAAIVTIVVLASAGLFPAVALVGLRLITVPLVPLAGAVIAALAATCFIAVGGSFIGWFVALAGDRRAGRRRLLGAPARVGVRGATGSDRRRRPGGCRPWRHGRRAGHPRLVCVWCLRGLATPTVGFDARALWLTRAGWFLQSHHQLLVKLRVRDVVLVQSVYPPLVERVDRRGLARHRRSVDAPGRGGHRHPQHLRVGRRRLRAGRRRSAGHHPVDRRRPGRRVAAHRCDRRRGAGCRAPMVVGVVAAVSAGLRRLRDHRAVHDQRLCRSHLVAGRRRRRRLRAPDRASTEPTREWR